MPGLPRLLHDYLKQPPDTLAREVATCWQEQRRTNRLLQGLVYGGIGICAGSGGHALLLVRMRLF
jgi:ubiquinone biosynthesis protein